MRPLSLDRNLFDDLAQRDGKNLISIFLPTHSKGRDVAQDRIRLKNQLASVDAEFERLGFKPRERRQLLERAEDWLDDREFWEHQGRGLAVYIDDEGGATSVSLRESVEESSVVMSVFLMRPLLAELQIPELAVLALTKGEVGLFVASPSMASRVDVDLPESFDDVNWFVDRERQRQQHPDRSVSGRARHGHDPSGQEGEDLSRFLREVDRALPSGDPIVVLGDDDLVSRFQGVTDRRVLSPENSGLRSPFTESEILDTAGASVEEFARDRQAEAWAEAKQQIGTGTATTDVSEAMSGAITGRIGELVVDPAADPIWGRVDETNLKVTIHEDRAHADVDLIDRIVVLSMQNGADVTAFTDPSTEYPFIAVTRF
ncbi:MAG TPA: hypothetical protein VF115_14780 [Acidimicrobiia bacterium]